MIYTDRILQTDGGVVARPVSNPCSPKVSPTPQTNRPAPPLVDEVLASDSQIHVHLFGQSLVNNTDHLHLENMGNSAPVADTDDVITDCKALKKDCNFAMLHHADISTSHHERGNKNWLRQPSIHLSIL